MPDPRVTKLAKVLINYSLKIKPGEQLLIQTTPLADELTLAAYEEAIKAGAHVMVLNQVPGTREIFFKYASDEQLTFISPLQKEMLETFDAFLRIWADSNTQTSGAIWSSQRRAVQDHDAAFCQRRFEMEHHCLSYKRHGTRCRYESPRLPGFRLRCRHAQRG